MTIRDPKQWHDTHHVHKNIPTSFAEGIHSIEFANGVTLDFLFLPKNSKTLVVWFSGAAHTKEAELRLPFLNGVKLASWLEGDHLCLGDSSLGIHNDIKLGWYVGDAKNDLQAINARLISALRNDRGYEKIVFYGGSGGGFAALELARRFDDALAIPCNPQTAIGAYHIGHVRRFTTFAFGERHIDAVASKYGRVIDVLADAPNPVFYFQNVTDDFHLVNHAAKYLSARGARPPEAGVITYADKAICFASANWGNGHTPLPAKQLAIVLRDVIECPSTVREYITNGSAERTFHKLLRSLET